MGKRGFNARFKREGGALSPNLIVHEARATVKREGCGSDTEWLS